MLLCRGLASDLSSPWVVGVLMLCGGRGRIGVVGIHHAMEPDAAAVHTTYRSFGIVNGRADWHTWLILKDLTGTLIGTHC